MTIRSLARFPRLRRSVWAVSAGIAGISAAMVPVRAEPAATSVYARSGGPPPAATPEPPAAQAERILVGSLVAVDRSPAVQIRFRQKARIGQRTLVGNGLYLQAGNGEDQRYRFESVLNADTESFETVEVCDGVTAWAYRRLGTEPARVERMDVRRVRERVAQFVPAGDGSISAYLGGLQRALWTGRQWFRFRTATAAEIDGLPVWVLEGRWHAESLAALQPTLRDAAGRPEGILPEELPDGMPWSIRVTIGRSDLLPRCVEYLAIPGPRPVVSGQPEPIAVLDLFDIRQGEAVDASAFIYRPAEVGQSDVTDAYVAGVGAMRP